MTIGKIYYLATICEKLGLLALMIAILFLILAGLAIGFYCDVKIHPSQIEDDGPDELQLAKKCIKWTATPLLLLLLLSLLAPSKEDFLVIALTKNYTSEQIYSMTKEEIKSSIDYLVKQIKEIQK